MNPQVYTGLKKIAAAGKELTEHLSTIDKYTYDKLEDVMTKIHEGEEKLAGVEAKLAETERIKKIEMELRLKQYGIEGAVELFVGQGYAKVKQEDYEKLQAELNIAKGDNKAEIDKAVAIAKRTIETKHKEETADSKIEMARINSELSHKNSQIEFLNKEVTRLTDELAQSGKRMVEIAQANKTVVNAGGK